MHKPLIIIFCLSIIVSGIYFLDADSNTIETTGEDKLADISGYAEFMFLKMADPHTGQIPANAISKAYAELKSRGYYNVPVAGSTRDAGWQPVNDFFNTLAITKIVYDPLQTQTFYFCTGEGWFNADAVKGAGVWKSEDGGVTWNQLPSTAIPVFEYCQDIDVHPLTGDIYVATRNSGLQRSTDGGTTWQKVLGSAAGSTRNSICDVEITSDGGVFVAIGIFETDGIYYSPNGDSASFAKQTVGLPGSGYYRIELAVAKSDPDIAYAIPCSLDYRIQGVYRTDDRGATWQLTELPGGDREMASKQAWYDLIMEVDPNDANVVIAGGLNLWRTTDGGGTWQQLSSSGVDSNLIRYVHVDQHAIVFRNSDEVYFGNDGGVYKCDNFTDNKPVIYSRNQGYNVTQFYSADINPLLADQRLIGGTQDNGSLMAINSGTGYFKPVSGADGAFTAYNTINDNIFYTATQFRRFYRFTNGGYELPDTLTIDTLTDNNVLFINPWTLDPNQPDNCFYASSIGLWRIDSLSTASRNDWEKACTIGGRISAIAVSNNPPGIAFIGRSTSEAEIYALYDAATVDAGSVPIGLDPNDIIPDGGMFFTLYCSSIIVDPDDANHIVTTYSNFGVESIWETKNALSGSPDWTGCDGDLPDIPVYWSLLHPSKPGVCYIATEMGVFYTNALNGDATQWIPCSSFPIVRTDMLKIRYADNTIVAATHGRGLWTATLDPDGINNDIVWQERGPTNVGGRTRAIMIDPNDPTGNTVWAGSVAGGLWKITDINYSAITPQPVANNFTVFPNPVTGHYVTADLSMFAGQSITITLYNAEGKLISRVLQDQNITANQQFKMPIPAAAQSGIAYIEIHNGSKRWVQKIIIVR